MFVNVPNTQIFFVSNCCDSDTANSVFRGIQARGSQIRPSNRARSSPMVGGRGAASEAKRGREPVI